LSQHYLSDIHQSSIVNVVRRLGCKSTNENINVQIQEVYETLNILAGGIQTLNDDTLRLSGESIRLQSSVESLTNEFTSLKLSIQEGDAFLESIKQEHASMRQTIDDMQYASDDGTLIWKITSFREKMSKFSSEN
jgi:chromosome segregation ATPase